MRKRRILVLDSNPGVGEVLQIVLVEWGYDVQLAASVSEAKSLLYPYDPEIVVSDVVMPELSGPALLRCLKAGAP